MYDVHPEWYDCDPIIEHAADATMDAAADDWNARMTGQDTVPDLPEPNTYEITLRGDTSCRTMLIYALNVFEVYDLMSDPDERDWYGIRRDERLIGADAIRRIA